MKTEIQISNAPHLIMETALKIATLIKNAHGKALIVGGAVRDLLLGFSPKDFDIEVFGIAPDKLLKILKKHFELDLVGLSFGVIKIRGVDIDIAIPRRESKQGLGHKGFEINSDPTLSINEAALRRDFTINAIYYDPLEDRLLDPYGGVNDLRNKILRHISDKFAEDPLRVLRGMQFIARFNLSAAPETIDICSKITPELLPMERLNEEWKKLLTKGITVSSGLSFLRNVGWTKYYPELQALIDCPQDKEWHPEGDVWTHTLLSLDAFAKRRIDNPREDYVVGLAVLCHDFGKPATTSFSDGHIKSNGHDIAGLEPTISFLRRLTNEESILNEVTPLVTNHMQPFSLWSAKAGNSAIRRLALRVKRIDRLIRVARADSEGRPDIIKDNQSEEEALAWLAYAANELAISQNAPKPILQGRDLIKMGLTPSPKFGRILSICFEAQLDGKFCDLEGAIRFLKTLL